MKFSTLCGWLVLSSSLLSALGCAGTPCGRAYDWNSPVLETGSCGPEGQCARYGSVLSHTGEVIHVSEAPELPAPPLAEPKSAQPDESEAPPPPDLVQ